MSCACTHLKWRCCTSAAIFSVQASHCGARLVTDQATVFLCAVDAGTLAPALQHYGSGLSACLAAPPGELKAKLVTTADIRQWRQLQQDGKEEEVVAALQQQLAAAAVTSS
jgi:hypothetical protein